MSLVVKRVIADELKCVNCRICMMTCSVVNFGEVDLSKSRVRVFEDERERYRITVCNNCGVCAVYCPQKAISIVNGTLIIDEGLCNGCGVCVEKCPTKAIWWVPRLPSPNKCVACGACVENCPTGALRIIESELNLKELEHKLLSR